MKSEGDDDTWFSGQNQENHRECLGSCKLPLPAVGEKKDAWLQVVGSKDEVGGGEPPQLHVVVEMKDNEEADRQAQEEAARKAQEEAERLAREEAERQAQEAARKAQEEAERQAQEAARKAQEE